ncbi:perlwapin-like [Haliotis rubra]|uniref:perlwapin-like n=1 Tax=Haliotis rubra TaxID=36100 RepID=UPI001EE52D98|nr:perlwapin-like [Haliotis rubra]
MAGPSSCISAVLVLTAVVSVTLSTELPSSCDAVHCEEGTVCKLQEGATRVPTTKPGSCPVLNPGGISICVAECSSDADCDGDLKCCGGCHKKCILPVGYTDKPGTCPWLPPHGTGSCEQQHQCSKDIDCDSKLKCCGSCPRRCVSPFP